MSRSGQQWELECPHCKKQCRVYTPPGDAMSACRFCRKEFLSSQNVKAIKLETESISVEEYARRQRAQQSTTKANPVLRVLMVVGLLAVAIVGAMAAFHGS